MKRSLTSLPVQLLTVVALPVLIVLMGIAFGSVTLHQAAMRDLVAGHDVQAVRGVAASLSSRLEQQSTMLLALAARAARAEDPAYAVGGDADRLFDGGVALYDASGVLLAASPRVELWQSSSPLRPDLAAALDDLQPGDDPAFVPLIEPGYDLTRVAIVLKPPPEQAAQPIGVIGVVSLNTLGLTTLLDTLRTSDSTTTTLATRDGLILFQTDPTRIGEFLPNTPDARAALRGESGADYRSDEEGREQIVTFAPVAASGWSLIQTELWDEMISPLMRYSQAAPLVLLPGLAITALAVGLGIYRIVRPLQRLEARAADLAAGDFQSIEEPVGGIDEIRRLQDSLGVMAGQVQKAQDVMRHYIAAITQAQEEERLRLAHELHDHMIQSLIALDHREQMLKRYLSDDPAGADVLAELRAMTAQAIDDLRRVIRAMRPIYLEDFGLVPALEVLARDLGTEWKLPVHFQKRGEPRRLAPEHEMALYRVAQESLNNARQHSRATQIWLDVAFEPEQVTVSVRDDGAGFKAPRRVTDLAHNGHFGLIGMYERAALIGAQLNIRSARGKGTTVTICAQTPEGVQSSSS